ncbi:MAG: D-alanine--D-alanine ligase [Candidatus Magasanikbacteria bacterium]|nr:D-alanine--D-alanine ligase [Candidatus Magasanikbacteria bacterium]
MHIALIYNIRHAKPNLDDPQYIKEAEFDEPGTIAGISEALERLGHKVYHIEADEDAYEKLKILKSRIDLVFNIAEGMHGADREAQIPAMLEMLQIPYTGPKPIGYALALHKAMAKDVMRAYGIPTPWGIVIKRVEQLSADLIHEYPVIAKPLSEGSSKGIRAKNLAHNFEDLREITRGLIEEGGHQVLIEEFLTGREFTVAMIGNPVRVLPIIEITFDDLPDTMPKFEHQESKWLYDNPEIGVDPLVCPAQISQDLQYAIEQNCTEAFLVLGMADWARFDVRLDTDGIPRILEVNCPPGIIPDPNQNSRFPRAAFSAGLSYDQMIEEILQSACMRYGIAYVSEMKLVEELATEVSSADFVIV